MGEIKGHVYKAVNVTFTKNSLQVNLPGACVSLLLLKHIHLS